jgi:WD40 repeat protein/serine/threonine protein kinase
MAWGTEGRLYELLLTYVEATESGHAPDRESFLRENSQFASEIAEFFAGEDRVEYFAAPLRSATQAVLRTIPVGPQTPGAGTAILDSPFVAGQAFGDYELISEIGRGGMGVVYKARQRSLNRLVAIKIIRAAGLASATEVQRFRNEAEAAAALDHPGIVPIYEIGQLQGQLFFTMKWVDGPNLAERLWHYRDDPGSAARLVVAIGRAVHHAHSQGILHRDLKPSNILLCAVGSASLAPLKASHTPLLTDFGLAKRLADVEGLTLTGEHVGTPSYMPPEQAARERTPPTPAADVYGLGAILYALVTGRPPFHGPSITDTIRQLVESEPPPPRRLNPIIARDLETICLKCLEKDPLNRYPSAAELTEDLERWLEHRPIEARPTSRPARAWRWCRRKPVVAALSATAGLLLILLIAGLTLGIVLVSAKEVEAQKQRLAAEQQEAVAQAQTAALRKRVYVADMAAAHQAWQYGDVDSAVALLRDQVPNEDQEDLRGFEWHYLHKLMTRTAREVHALVGHKDDAYSVCYSPNGKLIATAGKDGKARLWDAGSYRELHRFDHKTEVNGVAFSPDSEMLASCTDGGRIFLFNVAAGTPIREFSGHEGEVAFVEFSPDGKLLGSASKDETVRLWQIATGKVAILRAPGLRLEALAFAPDGKSVAAGGQLKDTSSCLKIWQTDTGVLQREITSGGSGFLSIAYSPVAENVAMGEGSGGLRIWQPARGTLIQDMLCHSVAALETLAYSRDGCKLFVGRRDGTCEVWNTGSARQRLRFQTNSGRIWRISPAPDGKLFATAGADGAVRTWELPKLDEYDELAQPEGLLCSLAFTPDSKTLLVSSGFGGIYFWDLATQRLIKSIKEPLKTWPRLAVSPDGRTLAAGYSEGVLRLCDLTSLEKTESKTALSAGPVLLPAGQGQILPAFLRGGNELAVCSGRSLTLWDLNAGQRVLHHELPIGPLPRSLAAIGPDRLAAITEDRIHFLNRQTSEWTALVLDEVSVPTCITGSPDGEIYAVGHQDGVIELFKTGAKVRSAKFTAHDAQVTAIAFSPDGRTLASCSREGTVQLWNMPTAQKLFTLSQTRSLVDLAFSPDGRFLAAAEEGGAAPNQPGRILLWEARAFPATQPK